MQGSWIEWTGTFHLAPIPMWYNSQIAKLRGSAVEGKLHERVLQG
jgi:hypothetical protein